VRTGLRPRRRTEWLKKRLEAFEQTMKITDQRLTTQIEVVCQAQERLEFVRKKEVFTRRSVVTRVQN